MHPKLPAITFVTGNANKLRELQQLAPAGLVFTAQAMELDEIQSLDLQQIVAHKLEQAYEHIQTPVIVEDVAAGLQSLNGLPGPFIKFFNQQLGGGALHQLSKMEHDRVTITCLAGYYDGAEMIFAEGTINGYIVAPRGDNGFGFDSVVVPDTSDGRPGTRTMAEMSAEEKNSISHRSLALSKLLQKLGDIGGK